MAEEQGPRPGATRDAASAAEPGTVSRLLVEIAQASEEEAEAAWRHALQPGDAVGRYQIRREIGRGGFGAVYEAFDPELGRTVALKALKPGRTKRLFPEEWIKKEAEAVAKLDHPAIVTIFDVGTCTAGAYLVMELLHGETLAERLEKGPVPVDEALRIAGEMAEGLAHAHSRGVLHLDLKPANVFVSEDGRVKLLDFGLAHLLGTDGSSGAGTPAYMAPEQAASGSVDARADVWAAGMVLGEMLTGKRPVEPATPRGPSPRPPSSQTERMWEPEKAPQAAPSPIDAKLAGAPRPVARVVEAALSVDPEKRPKDGSAWLASLRSARAALERPRRARRVAVLAGVGIAIGLAVAGFATWRVWERQIPGGRPTVAVADFANDTGDRDLDAISGLLTTSLEQGTQLRVLTRSRMLDVLRQLGRGDAERIDETLAREVGRQTRANALLLASIRRLGDGYVVEMRALDPLHDEYIFTVNDRASGKQAVFDLVDRLAAATRRRLGVQGVQATPPPRVASITTGNPTAWRLLFQARQAFDRGQVEKAGELAREAAQLDPDFALARFTAVEAAWWLADPGMVVRWLDPDRGREARTQVEDLEKSAERLPEKERLSLAAMRASLDERWEEVFRIRDQIVEAYPLDKNAHYLAGEARVGRQMEESAMPYFQRALELDPGYGPAIQGLARSIATVGHAEPHLDWLRRQAASTGDEREMFWIATALLAADLEAEAVALYRRMTATHGACWPPQFYVQYLCWNNRAPEAEAALREALEVASAASATTGCDVEQSVLGNRLYTTVDQGRLREWWELSKGWSVIERNPRIAAGQRITFAAAFTRDATELRKALEELDRMEPGQEHLGQALQLAKHGHLDLAFQRAVREIDGPGFADLDPESQRMAEAVVAWGRGAREDAERKISATASRPGSHGAARLAAEFAFARGDCARVIQTLEPLRALRWSWNLSGLIFGMPRSLHLLATCHERTGDFAKARERNDELLRRWARADPELPYLIEAKAMQERLGVK